MLIQFVQNSGVAAGLIAVILLLRRVRKLPSGCLDALWIAALVRLFIPFNLPSPFSIYRLLAHTPQPDTLSTSLTQSLVPSVYFRGCMGDWCRVCFDTSGAVLPSSAAYLPQCTAGL